MLYTSYGRKLTILLLLVIMLPLKVIGQQDPNVAKLDAALKEQIKLIEDWGKDAVIAKEVALQNDKKITLTTIQAIDKDWIANHNIRKRVYGLLNNGCAKELKRLALPANFYPEAFVMDNQGALVGMTNKTSDYWQGDEPKWQKSFDSGKGAVFVDRPKLDLSTQAVLVQISVPVKDDKGNVIGAITVGLNLEQLKKSVEEQASNDKHN